MEPASNLLELWLNKEPNNDVDVGSCCCCEKKFLLSRYLQCRKRADRTNNKHKYTHIRSHASIVEYSGGTAHDCIETTRPNNKHSTWKCVIFIYFDFMRIFSFMRTPIFESMQPIEYIALLLFHARTHFILLFHRPVSIEVHLHYSLLRTTHTRFMCTIFLPSFCCCWLFVLLSFSHFAT